MSAPSHLVASLAGRYRVEREIGRGGMATVYLAHDIKHERRVALKVLNPELGAVLGVERFLAEIRVTANLQHPNLVPLFDSGEANGLLFYVMPYVDGESLRARLQREKQLPIDDAVRIAAAIAGALDYAHRHGVIHRDLKPENILLHEGQPLVADFGIALAVSNAGGNRITQTGLSLGTPQYMSPEQATGDRDIDGRTDIYSLGAMLYEMLVGDPPYLGGTSQAVIAKVLTEKPRSVRLGRPTVPEHVDATVERALEKLPADRFATGHELVDALQGRLTARAAGSAAGRLAATPSSWSRARVAAIVAGVLSALAAGVLIGAKLLAPEAQPSVPVRFAITAGGDTPDVGLPGAMLDISGDGTTIAFVEGATRLIHVRRLNELVVRRLDGTDHASYPVFSPDGRSIAFLTPSGVKVIGIDGGPSRSLTPSPVEALSWRAQDRLLGVENGSLAWISANTGQVTTLARRDSAGIWMYLWARLLEDGETVLFVASGTAKPGVQHLGVMDADGSDIALLDFPLYNLLGLIDDHLIYLSFGRAITAVRFDVRRRQTVGAPVVLIENVVTGGFGAMRAALSARGSLVYQPSAQRTELALVDSAGRSETLSVEAQDFRFPRFSPDGQKLAVTVGGEGSSDIWIYDLRSRTLQRLTHDGGDRPEWSQDGRRVLFRTNRSANGEQIWWQPADGSGAAEALQTMPTVVPEAVISPDGKYLVYRVNSTTTPSGRDIWYRALAGDTTPRPFVATPAEELMPRLSPDGTWLAYVSNTSGTREVYAQRFPGGGAVAKVSSGGGDEPIWSRDGRRLYYRNPPAFIAATVSPDGDRMRVVSRTTVHEGSYPTGGVHASWDIAHDGRLLVRRSLGETSQFIVVHDWRTEVLALLKPGR